MAAGGRGGRLPLLGTRLLCAEAEFTRAGLGREGVEGREGRKHVERWKGRFWYVLIGMFNMWRKGEHGGG